VGSYVTRSSWTACDGAASTFSGTPAVGSLSGFSSPGPTRDGRMKPDLVAPGETILSTTSFDLGPACPAPPASSVLANDAMNHTAMRGTSMAAPHVAGAIALLLQKRGPLTPAEIVAYLAAQAHRDVWTGGTAGNDWGSGKLALGDLVDPTIGIASPTPGADLSVGQTTAITWTATDSLGSVASVDVQLSRGGAGGPYEMLASGAPNGGSWSWTVSGPPTTPGQAVLRLVAHDTNENVGTSTMPSGFTIRDPLAVPAEAGLDFALGEVLPNPATGPLRVSFVVGRDAVVRLWVEDVQGRRIASLASGWHRAGRYEARWDPRAAGGAAPGLYFLSYETPGGRRVRRVAVTR